jgi:PAS domain S-box-containing protein
MINARFLLFIAAGTIVFIIDTIAPLGYGIWLLYILLIYFFISYSDKNNIKILSGIYICFLIGGYFLSPPAVELKYIPIFNRFTTALILTFFTVLGIREKEAKKISSELLERIKDIFIAIDRKFRIIFMNNSAQKFLGLPEEAAGKSYFEIFPEAKNSIFEESFTKSFTEQHPVHFEGEILSTGNFFDVSVYPSDKGLSLFAKDITKTVISERKLKKLLHEKEVLLKEIHHRTKNNFQLILSLLNLQLNNIHEELTVRILNETRARILSIASLYDKLHFSGNIYSVNMHHFIKDIVVKMDTAANFGIVKMDHELDIDNIFLRLDTAIPIGLIINELYTNSLKYAFNGSRQGAIKIKICFEDEKHLLIKYKDNGKGLPEHFNLDSGSLGTSIISSFVEQLDGSISFFNDHGAEFDIRLKVEKPEENDLVENQMTIIESE